MNHRHVKCESSACIYMDLRNVSCLISSSSHHWDRNWSRDKLEPLDNCICSLSSMKMLKVGGHLHCALYDAVSNDCFIYGVMHFGLPSCFR